MAQSLPPLLVPSTQNLLLVTVALEVAVPKKSEKVPQHEPTAQAVVSLQAIVGAELYLFKVILIGLLHLKTLATPPRVKVTLSKSRGAQTPAAVATLFLVSLAQQ